MRSNVHATSERLSSVLWRIPRHAHERHDPIFLAILPSFQANSPPDAQRFPFYYPLKTIFLLYLALPQFRGASYIYTAHLQPLFHTYEPQIDATLASLKVRIYTFLQERARALWEHVSAALRQDNNAAAIAGMASGAGVVDSAPQPTLADPVSGPAQIVSGLWRSYGPTIIASGAAILRQAAASASTTAGAPTPALDTPALFRPQSERTATGASTQSLLDRRRQLEAELAALASASVVEHQPEPVPIPKASPSYTPSPTHSDSDLRERGGKFEEVDVPSDAEGYDVGSPKDVQGHAYERPAAPKRTSWFWGSGESAGGYEKLKSE